jgi:sortase A
MLLVLFAAGFIVYLIGLSSVTESRAQTNMFKSFSYALSQAVAPVGPVKEGLPVAILNIPQIGLTDAVVVEGTSSRDLTLGPGHVRASVLPGQAGASFIYGKAVTFGAPFGHLMQLKRGDRITVTTGQGTSTFVVSSFGDTRHPAPANSLNRLVLMTSASSSPFPNVAVQVSADLVSAVKADPGGWPGISQAESYLAWDPAESLLPLLLWSQALLLASITATVAAHRWSRWPAYLVMSPVIIALTWCVYENLAGLLTNLF